MPVPAAVSPDVEGQSVAMINVTMRTQRGKPRRTKIIATLGPASSEVEQIAELIQAGMNIARINCSHGNHEQHRRTFSNVREAARALGRTVAILFDLSGPKIRIRDLVGDAVQLVEGERITFVRGDAMATPEAMTTTLPTLVDDLQIGDPVYLDDGNIQLHVVEKDADTATARVVVGGILKSRKGLNLPGSRISVPALTEKDVQDMELGVSLGVDFFALSFVREAQHVQDLRDRLKALRCSTPIISKIEKPAAVENIEAIIQASDAIMVARGDLGVELPVEVVPTVQKRVISACRRAMKPVIVATQMLESMIQNARPTRAEVSDVANAIMDGADAVMLSAETASGEHPVAAITTMAEVAYNTERYLFEVPGRQAFATDSRGDPYRMAIIESAANIAEKLGAKFIVVRSESGETARFFGKLRSVCPVIAANPSDAVLRRHALYWGVLPVKTSSDDTDMPTMESELRMLARELFNQGLAMPSDRIIVVSHYPWGEQRPPNSIRATSVGDVLGAA